MFNRWIGAVLLAAMFVSCSTSSENTTDNIKKLVDQYITAYNAKDVQAMTQLWSEGAEYVRPESGQAYYGLAEIEELYTQSFLKQPNKLLSVAVEFDSIELEGTDLAIFRGTTSVSSDESKTRFKAILTYEKGKWLLASVSEIFIHDSPPKAKELEEIDWLVGHWVDSDDYISIDIHCEWTHNKHFLERKFTRSVNDEPTLCGTQIIGWNSAMGHFDSWTYLSNGSFGTSKWESSEDNSWVIYSSMSLPDGKRSTAVHILRKLDEDSLSWRSLSREVDGELLPATKEIIVVRKKEEA